MIRSRPLRHPRLDWRRRWREPIRVLRPRRGRVGRSEGACAVVVVRGSELEPTDTRKNTNMIMAEYKQVLRAREVTVVESPEAGYRELAAPDAEVLVIIGHNQIDLPGP